MNRYSETNANGSHGCADMNKNDVSIIFIMLSDDGPILLWPGSVRRLVLL